jgi:hypothetical protein
VVDFPYKSPVEMLQAAGVPAPSRAIEVILLALHAGRPSDSDKRLWRSLSTQSWPAEKKRRAAIVIGRRGMKTGGVLANDAVFEALNPAHDPHAQPGSNVYVLIVAPRLRQAKEAVADPFVRVLEKLAPLGVSHDIKDAEGSPRIVVQAPWLKTTRIIAIEPSSNVSVRGYALAYVGIDEAGFLGSSEWLAQTDLDLVRALQGGKAQFPDARMVLLSSCGPPQGVLHSLATKPPRDCLVVRAATWITNPKLSEADCRREAGDDVDLFETEFASRRWGYANESYISAADVNRCFDDERAGKDAQPGGSYVLAFDLGQIHDDSCIAVCSNFDVATRPGEYVKHVTLDFLEIIKSDKKRPTDLEWFIDRVAAVSRAYNNAPLTFDQFCGATVAQLLEKKGFRKAEDAQHLRGRKYLQASMSPMVQTPRWGNLRSLILSRRLHLHHDHEPVAKQISQLKATMMSTGALKVEGRKDDAADALALAADLAVHLTPTGEGQPRWIYDHIANGHGGPEMVGRRCVKTVNGRVVPSEPREDDPTFGQWAEDMMQQGYSTPAVDRYRAHRGD